MIHMTGRSFVHHDISQPWKSPYSSSSMMATLTVISYLEIRTMWAACAVLKILNSVSPGMEEETRLDADPQFTTLRINLISAALNIGINASSLVAYAEICSKFESFLRWGRVMRISLSSASSVALSITPVAGDNTYCVLSCHRINPLYPTLCLLTTTVSDGRAYPTPNRPPSKR